MDLSKKPPMRGLLLIAGTITLVVTLLRILGESKGWDENLFNREAGGRSWFGIIWLVPVLGSCSAAVWPKRAPSLHS